MENPWPNPDHPLFDEVVSKMKPSILLDTMYGVGLITKDEWISLWVLPKDKQRSESLLRDLLPGTLETFRSFCSVLRGNGSEDRLGQAHVQVAGLLERNVHLQVRSPEPREPVAKHATIFIRSRRRELIRREAGKLKAMFVDTFEMSPKAVLIIDQMSGQSMAPVNCMTLVRLLDHYRLTRNH